METKEILKKLVNVPSISNNENEICAVVFEMLSKIGMDTRKVAVDEKGFCVYAVKGDPKIILNAHLDTVPPHIPFSDRGEKLFGRGCCDTKGSAAAMICAASDAIEKDLTDFGLLFTVGEEVDFRGAIEAKKQLSPLPFMIVGEPTSLRPVTAHFGVEKFTFLVKGIAAHSGYPWKGDNSISKAARLIVALEDIKAEKNTTFSICIIKGGEADNIIPAETEFVLTLRRDPDDDTDYKDIFSRLLSVYNAVIGEHFVLPAVACDLPETLSFLGAGKTVSYGTELSIFKNGVVLGPGSIENAHQPDEFVLLSELEAARELYLRILKNDASHNSKSH
ncbi:M20/M25/M40 family metallo-hydrolase [Candidatus Calescamantes bacterium]|nr:M20/M25/M40 family metallo-hydrolase [Candidatus Calescamantes bacterium]